MFSEVFWITIISLLSKGVGFIKSLLYAYFFGTGETLDALVLAEAIPGIFLGWLIAISISFTPKYTYISANNGKKEADKYTNSIIAFCIVIGVGASVIAFLNSNLLIEISGGGLSVDGKKQAASFLKVIVWYILFDTPNRILIARLNVDKKYIRANITTIAVSCLLALSVFLGAYIDEVFLSIGLTCAYAIQFFLLLLINSKSGYRFKFEIADKYEIKNTFLVSWPVFVSMIAADVNTYVDKVVASELPIGTISSLSYGFTVRDFFYVVLGSSINNIFYPKISSLVAAKEEKKAREFLVDVLGYIMVIFIPIAVISVAKRESIIRFIYFRGEFNSDSLLSTSMAFAAYMVGVGFLLINDLFGRYFYSLQKGQITMSIGIISMLTNVLLDIVLGKTVGILGLAIATSVSALVVVPIYLILFRKWHSSISYNGISVKLIKCFAAALTMMVSMYLLSRVFEGKLNYLIDLMIQCFCGVASYVIVCRLLKVDEVTKILRFFQTVVGRLTAKNMGDDEI